MSKETTPEMYLEMWLSEQIPAGEWLRLLEWRRDIKEFYERKYKYAKTKTYNS